MQPMDRETVAAVWHAARKAVHSELGISGETGMTLDDSRRVLTEVIAPRFPIHVADRGGTVVGFLALRGRTLDRMYVRPGLQHRGVGTALMAKARELSPGGLSLHTHLANRAARRFYENQGFIAVRFGMSPPPENEPDVEYRWYPD